MSVSFVESAVKLNPDAGVSPLSAEPAPNTDQIDEAKVFEAMVSFQDSSRFFRCELCAQQAVFVIPDGLRCDEHAWQAAALLDWEANDPWVPIRIDRSNA